MTVVGRNDCNGARPYTKDSMALQVLSNTGIISLHDVNKIKMASSSMLVTNTPEIEVREGESSDPLFKVKRPSGNGLTSLTLLVRDASGNELYLPVRLGNADGGGNCGLFVQLPV